MRTKFTLLLVFLFIGMGVCRAAIPEGYTMVKNIAALQEGDRVVTVALTEHSDEETAKPEETAEEPTAEEIAALQAAEEAETAEESEE